MCECCYSENTCVYQHFTQDEHAIVRENQGCAHAWNLLTLPCVCVYACVCVCVECWWRTSWTSYCLRISSMLNAPRSQFSRGFMKHPSVSGMAVLLDPVMTGENMAYMVVACLYYGLCVRIIIGMLYGNIVSSVYIDKYMSRMNTCYSCSFGLWTKVELIKPIYDTYHLVLVNSALWGWLNSLQRIYRTARHQALPSSTSSQKN